MLYRLISGSAFYTARFHETIVMVHHEMALYLLQRIEYYAYQDKQRRTSEELCKLGTYACNSGKGGKNGNNWPGGRTRRWSRFPGR